MRLFLDTNVLFDIFAQRKPFEKDAKRLIIMQSFGDAELWAAPQSYLDLFYVLRKIADTNILQQQLATSLQRITICTTAHTDILAAAQTGWNDLEDALIGICCKKTRADYLITRDIKGFKQLNIPCYTPAKFFNFLENEQGIYYDVSNLQ